jgi:5-methylcytosine-specific restriction protein B
VSRPKRGFWGLTPEGREAHLTSEESRSIYLRVRDDNRLSVPDEEAETAAPGTAEDTAESTTSYWFVGAVWGGRTEDQVHRFLTEGIWENGHKDRFLDLVGRMKPGDRIAIKASFVQTYGLPFDVGEKPVSVMRIKATGMILENYGDGRKVKVAWDPPFEPRDWYFYTYRRTIVEADMGSEDGRRLRDKGSRCASSSQPSTPPSGRV